MMKIQRRFGAVARQDSLNSIPTYAGCAHTGTAFWIEVHESDQSVWVDTGLEMAQLLPEWKTRLEAV
jgi:hypothetical protein